MSDHLSVDAQRIRAAKNESLFREINERIKSLNESFGLDLPTGEWVCECADTNCTELLEMTPEAYEALRSHPMQFVLARGHELPEVEQVVEDTDRYRIVRKLGVGGEASAASANAPPATAAPTAANEGKPVLVIFYSPQSGRCRRVDGFLAQVLQRRQNHETFRTVRVSVEERPELAEKFAVVEVPTLCVIDGQKLVSRISSPRGARELEEALEPWLH
ncbi:MAG: thioredoxin family protein [Gaiellaceae bacterium]